MAKILYYKYNLNGDVTSNKKNLLINNNSISIVNGVTQLSAARSYTGVSEISLDTITDLGEIKSFLLQVVFAENTDFSYQVSDITIGYPYSIRDETKDLYGTFVFNKDFSFTYSLYGKETANSSAYLKFNPEFVGDIVFDGNVYIEELV